MAARVRVEYSEHSKERLKQRGITRQQVAQCLFDGTLIGFDLRGRKMNQKQIDKRLLIVIYIDSGPAKVVITAYWKGIEP